MARRRYLLGPSPCFEAHVLKELVPAGHVQLRRSLGLRKELLLVEIRHIAGKKNVKLN